MIPNTPADLPLSVVQGTTFRLLLRWLQPDRTTPVDLTGYTATATANVKGYEIVFADDGDGSIELGDADGTIELYAARSVIEATPRGHGRWHLEVLPPDGDDDVLISGTFLVRAP